MKIKIAVLITLHILPVLSKSTGDPDYQIQCPSLPPNQHVSRLHCKMADGSLIHVYGPGPFDCEMFYVAVRPQTVKGNKNQDLEETSNGGSENCELLLIKFTDDVVHHGCCKDGVAVFAPQEHHVPSPQPIDPIDERQKPIQHLQKDDHIMDDKVQTKSEEGLNEEDDYDDDGEGPDEGGEDYEYDDDDTEEESEEDEDGDEDYEDYGVDEDINDENSPDSGAGQEPEAQQDNEFKDL
ncbi:uncharacterized protein FSUBG_6230 [Fusarium subglutinans]|uniref:Secreted protein n=1 Tax=Gibberella subglutinans TaxID=42677 RepID=A0A8H5V1S0_GIBSU|nr:uncharacterized protein FSUBG_6230 [Fusarium subglutinans]KAF5606213.1 hypothetical protein FSUBG_6230 [Fusarium subglutinans]